MTEYEREAEALALNDEDRLPWLEAVEDEEASTGTGKLTGLVLAALGALALVLFGMWAFNNRPAPAGTTGDGTVIAAQEGDYKVRPDSPGGMKVEGQGDSAFATSEGAQANGRIDTNATTETPVAATKPSAPAKPVTPAGKEATTAVPANGGKLVAAAPAVPPPPTAAAAPAGSLIQLGAYGSTAKANEAWIRFTKRFAYLAPLSKTVEQAEVGGSTVYRLRANAGGDAASVCGKLKVAGESCMVVN